MKNVWMFILLLICTSCGTYGHQQTLQISGFEQQVTAFEQAAALVGEDVTIRDLIITLNSSIGTLHEAGVCHPNIFNTTPLIELNTQLWGNYSDTEKEVLLFHELGHCILGRLSPNMGHVNTINSDGMPVSIMYYSITPYDNLAAQQYYVIHRLDYLYELFGK